MEKNNKKQFGYKYIVLALCFLVVLTGLGFCSSNRSLYLSAITEFLPGFYFKGFREYMQHT